VGRVAPVAPVAPVALVDPLVLAGRAVELRLAQVGISESADLVARAVPECR